MQGTHEKTSRLCNRVLLKGLGAGNPFRGVSIPDRRTWRSLQVTRHGSLTHSLMKVVTIPTWGEETIENARYRALHKSSFCLSRWGTFRGKLTLWCKLLNVQNVTTCWFVTTFQCISHSDEILIKVKWPNLTRNSFNIPVIAKLRTTATALEYSMTGSRKSTVCHDLLR